MCLLVPALGFPAFRLSQSAQLTSSLHLRTHLMWGSAWERQGWKYVFFFQNSSLVIHFRAARCPQCPAVLSPAVTPVALSPALHCLLAGGGGGGRRRAAWPPETALRICSCQRKPWSVPLQASQTSQPHRRAPDEKQFALEGLWLIPPPSTALLLSPAQPNIDLVNWVPCWAPCGRFTQ